jgi:hypothetical protein
MVQVLENVGAGEGNRRLGLRGKPGLSEWATMPPDRVTMVDVRVDFSPHTGTSGMGAAHSGR